MDTVTVIIETPKGSHIKFDYDKKLRVLNSKKHYLPA